MVLDNHDHDLYRATSYGHWDSDLTRHDALEVVRKSANRVVRTSSHMEVFTVAGASTCRFGEGYLFEFL